MKERAVILCANLAGNCLGRALALAELLSEQYEVRIVGHSSHGIWAPALDHKIPIIKLAGRNWLGLLLNWQSNCAKLDADVLIVSKPLPANMIYACHFARSRPSMRVVMDIDDDELGLMRQRPLFKRHLEAVLRLPGFRSYYHALWAQALARRFSRISCASSRLQRKFGGSVVYHARRPEMLRGVPLEPELQKRRDALAARRTVLFLGTPRIHKGLDVLAQAMAKIGDASAVLAIVGCSNPEQIRQSLLSWLPAERLQCIGQVPLGTVAQWLSAATVVVIPQQDTLAGNAQTPAKLFDAMCCGAALVTTRVGDIPGIVGNAAVLIDTAADTAALTSSLERLLSDESIRQELRQRLKRRYAREFSFETTALRLRMLCADQRSEQPVRPESQTVATGLEMKGT